MKTIFITFLFVCTGSFANCQTTNTVLVKSQIISMMDSVKKDIYTSGPVKWLYYFKDTNAFFMASDGKLVFADFTSAGKFINDTLAHIISKVKLDWKNINIDLITATTASINAYYNEDLTGTDKSIIHSNGYCTALVNKTAVGWKFLNLHWSSAK